MPLAILQSVVQRPWYVRFSKDTRSRQARTFAAIAFLGASAFWGLLAVVGDQEGVRRVLQGILAINFLFLGATIAATPAWEQKEQQRSGRA
jgi:hypothetical protein